MDSIVEQIRAKNEALEQMQKELDDITLSVIAYQAKSVNEALEASKNPINLQGKTANEFLKQKFTQILTEADEKTSFSPERAAALSHRYEVLGALDSAKGAGAVYLKDTYTNTLVKASRGTDMVENLINDVGTADIGNIVLGNMPMGQYIDHLNDYLRHSTPKGQMAPQLRSNDDKITMQVLTGSAMGITSPTPLLSKVQPVEGTGLLTGLPVRHAGHSEASVYATALGSVSNEQVSTLYGPALMAPLSIVNQTRSALGLPELSKDQLGLKQTNLHGTGLSVVDGSAGAMSLPGKHETLSVRGGHSSAQTMHDRLFVIEMFEQSPRMKTREEAESIAKHLFKNIPEQDREAVLSVYNENKGADIYMAAELVALSKGRESVTMAGYGHGEAAYQDALRQMQEANNKAIAEAAKYDTASQHGQQLNQLRQQANTDYNNAPFDYKETRGGDPEGKKTAEQTYREYKDNRYHGANEYTKDHKAIEKDQQYHHYTPPKPYNQSENEKLQGKSWSDASDVLPAVGGAFASANSLEKGSYGETLDGLNRSLSPNLEEMLKAPTTAFSEKQTEVQHTSMYTVPSYSSEPPPQPTAEQIDQMRSLMAQNPVFTSLPSEQQTAMLTSFASAAQTATQTTTTGLNDASQQTVQSSMQQPVEQINPTAVTPNTAQPTADSIQLTPKIAKLHEQITQHLTQGQFGNQIAHLSETEQQAAIALATHEATRNLARSVDYVWINKDGNMMISFDGDKGFSSSVNIAQAQTNDASQVLTASLDLQQSQQQAAAQRLEQSKNQSGPTMTV